jgi:hypothetical protein
MSQFIRTATGLSILQMNTLPQGSNKNTCPLLLVISILALKENKTQIIPPEQKSYPTVRQAPSPSRHSGRKEVQKQAGKTASAQIHQASREVPFRRHPLFPLAMV